MAIPIGKLALYTAAAGIYPAWTLPVSLDVGTDREEALHDPLYLGYRAPRLRGAAYDEVLEAFVEAVGRVYPAAVVQWEDFKQHNALRILERYRHRLPSFNDDVQGTGAVVLAGMLAARREQGGLAGERVLFLGAGAASIGIAGQLRRQLDARGRAGRPSTGPPIALMDHTGLVHLERPELADDQRAFAVDPRWFIDAGLAPEELKDPVAIARVLKPTILVGTTGCRGAFTEALVREVASHVERPLILPLSNPGDRAEAQPERDRRVDGGPGHRGHRQSLPAGRVQRHLPHRRPGQQRLHLPGGRPGAPSWPRPARSPTMPSGWPPASWPSHVSAERLASGAIYPPISELRHVARAIAVAVVRHLRDTGYGRQFRDEEIEPAVERAIWWPDYLPVVAGATDAVSSSSSGIR